MAYLNFLLIYLALPVLLLLLTQPRPLAGLEGSAAPKSALGIGSGLMVLYTVPLVSYLARLDIWWHEPDRLYAVIAYAPLEEYLIAVLAPLLAGLTLLQVLGRNPSWWKAPPPSSSQLARIAGAVLAAALAGLGLWFVLEGADQWRYLGLILAWAGPVFFGLSLYGGHLLRGQLGRLFLISTGLSTAYLWITLWAALAQYLRLVSRAYTTGLRPLGVPVEDALLMLCIVAIVNAAILLPLVRHSRSATPRSSEST